MAQPQLNVQGIITRPTADREKAVKILSKSIYKDLKAQGFDHKQIVALATELISQVTAELGGGSDDSSAGSTR
jgi:hypothetical protein